MPGNALTTASSVGCGHPGGTVNIDSAAKLTVGGHPVLLESSVFRQKITGCKLKPPPPSNTACTAVLSVVGTPNPRLTVGGSPVLLDGMTGTTNGSPPGSLTATANQSKLSA